MINLYKLHSKPKTLFGYARMMKVPRIAWEMTNNEQKDKLKSLWLQDPWYAYRYALLTKKPWPEAEPVIAQDSYASSDYAHIVLQDRFPAGEAAIARDPELAMLYAVYVIKGPFPQAEAVIANDEEEPANAHSYAVFCLKKKKPHTWAKRYKAKHGL